MNVIITGATGVVGEGLIPALRKLETRRIRALSRHAVRDVSRWDGVEPYPADITEPDQVREAAEGFDAMVHIAGIEKEHPPQATFDEINVEGTRHIVDECERAGVRRIVFVSTFKADEPVTDYQRSQHESEKIIRDFSGDWVILRPSAVYGPGDQHLSVLLRIVRSFPAVPIIGDGSQCIQPIWYEDFGKAIARCLERDDLSGETLTIGGRKTTVTEVVERLREITGRRPRLVRVPESIALGGSSLADHLGFELPINETQLRLVAQESCIEKPMVNALDEILGIDPIDLGESLRILADSLPEQLADEASGDLRRKIFEVAVEGVSADDLFSIIRSELPELMPVEFGVEPGSDAPVEVGRTLTALMRENEIVQFRVEQLEQRKLTIATVEGHPLAGAVRFLALDRQGGALARIEVYARTSDLPRWITARTATDPVESGIWQATLHNLVERSHGTQRGGITSSEEILDDPREQLVEEWIRRLIDERRRERDSASIETARLDTT